MFAFVSGFDIAAFFSVFGVIFLLVTFGSILWILAIIDAVRRQFYNPDMKLVWILIIFFTHFIGAVVYFIFGRQQGDL